MSEQTNAARLATGAPRQATGKYLKRWFDAFKFPVAAAFLVIAFVFADLPESKSDDLLLKLTVLSRKGAVALCNPAHIENELSVQIDGNSKNREFNGNFSSIGNSPNQLLSGNYSKFQAGELTVCKLQLRVAGRQFCGSDSARTQRLIGRRVQPRMPMLGEPGFYDHGYELAHDATQRTVLGWREPAGACPAAVDIVAAVR